MALLIIILIFLFVAAGFAVYLVRRDQGEKEPLHALWQAFGFGIAGLAIALVVENAAIPDVFLDGRTYPLTTLILPALGVGIIEELAKAGPLMAFIYKKRYFNEHTDGIMYFALAGLGFGLPENIFYTLQFGAAAGIGRLFLTPFFHAATTGLIGYFFVQRKLDRVSMWVPVAAVTGVIGLHSLYDFGLSTNNNLLIMLSVAVTVLLTLSLFRLFACARRIDQAQGLSVVGNNAYCRSCGHPNPKHQLYCTACGRHA